MAGKEGGGGTLPGTAAERIGRVLEDMITQLEQEGRDAQDRLAKSHGLAKLAREVALAGEAEARNRAAQSRARMTEARERLSVARAERTLAEVRRLFAAETGEQRARGADDDDDIGDADLSTLPADVRRRAALLDAAGVPRRVVGDAEPGGAPGAGEREPPLQGMLAP